MKTIPEKIGIAIKKIREEYNLSQEQLAEKSKLHRTYISDIERGVRNVTIVSLAKILSCLDISFQEFFTIYFEE